MSDYNLGTARGVIEIEYKGDGAKQAQEGIKGVGKESQSTEQSLNQVAGTAGKAGLVIAGGLTVAVAAATSFEKQMSAVKAVSGATGDEFQALSDKALQIGKDTTYSASEAALAMEELAKAGISTQDILGGAAEATVALAAAGGVDLPTAATVASNAMNQFGLKAEDMAHTADLFAGAANASATGVEEIGTAMAYVGPIARTAGLSIDDTAAAISVLANNGIDASSAGTSLRGILAQLTPTTEGQTAAFEKLGIITKDGSNAFYDSEGNLKSFSDVAATLRDGVNSLGSEQEKTAVITAAFGRNSLAGVAAIANTTSDDLTNLQNVIGNTNAADVAATRLDNFAGTLEALQGSLETVAISVGQVLIPVLGKIATGVSVVADGFNALPGPVKTVVTVLLAIVAAALLAFAAITKIVFAVKNFVAALKVIRAALALTRLSFIATWIAALGPIALIVAAIAIVIAIIVLLWKKSETFRDIVKAVWEAIKAAVSAVVEWFKGLPALFAGIWDSIKGAFTALKDWFVGAWEAVKAVFSTVLNAIGTVISTMFNFYKTIVMTVFEAIKTVVMTYINIVQTVISTVLGVITGIWNAFWGLLGGVVTAAWELIKSIIVLAWTIIKGVFLTYLNLVMAVWTALWNGMKAVLTTVWNAIKAVITTALSVISTVVSTYLNIVKSVFTTVWNAIKAVIQAVWGTISGIIRGALSAISAAMTAAWNTIKSAVTTAWNAVKTTVSNAISTVVSTVRGLKDTITGIFSGAASWLFDAGKKIIQGIIDGIKSMIGGITNAVKSVTGVIGKFLPGSPVKEGPLMVLNNGYAGKKIVEMVADGMLQMKDPLAETMNTVVAVPVVTSANDFMNNPGFLPPPAPAGPPTPTTETRSRGNLELTVINPIPEPASESLTRAMQKVAYLGFDATEVA